MKKCKKMLESSVPLIGMIIVQVIATGLQTISRVVLTQGTFLFALLTYRHLLAALCISPFAFYLERGNGAKLTLMAGFWVFLNSLSGITMAMGMFYYGLRDTSATYATNFLNLIPIVTFIFSIITRIEKIHLKSTKGKVKVAGTIMCLGGALIISLYKGCTVVHGFHSHSTSHATLKIPQTFKSNRTRGTFLLIGSIISYSTWFITQVKLLKEFPSKCWATMLTCISGAIQTTLVGVCFDRRLTSWMIGWNLELVTIAYSGVLASAASFCLISWAVSTKGPTYPTMFTPLSLIFVAIIEVMLLGDDLHIGSVAGMMLIIMGVYSFLWGSSKEEEKTKSPLPRSVIVANGGEGESTKSIEMEGAVAAAAQSTATVFPTASPLSFTYVCHDDDDDDSEHYTGPY